VDEGQTRGIKSFALALLAITTKETKNLEIHPNGLQKDPETPVFCSLGGSKKSISVAGEKAEQEGEMEQKPICGGEDGSFSIAAFGSLRDFFLQSIGGCRSGSFGPVFDGATWESLRDSIFGCYA